MLHQIRKAMANIEFKELFEGIVEVDETYIGGKPRKGNAILDKDGNVVYRPKPNAKRGRGTKKTPVVGVKERSSGRVYAKVMLPDEKGRKLTGTQLVNIIKESCKEGAVVMTDDNPSYNLLEKGENKDKFRHFTVNHSKGQYYAGDGIHTNGIENLWSVMKNGIRGSYHHISIKYLQRYIDEFRFKQNTRIDKNMFDVLLRQSVLKAAKK
jgi:transposase-like protein